MAAIGTPAGGGMGGGMGGGGAHSLARVLSCAWSPSSVWELFDAFEDAALDNRREPNRRGSRASLASAHRQS